MTENSIRERLDAYRRQRRRNEMTETIKNAIQTVLPWTESSTAEDPLLSPPQENVENVPKRLARLGIESLQDLQDVESSSSDDNVDPETEIQRQSQTTLLRKAVYLLCFLLWAVLYIIAIEVQFGAIYFIASTFIFICVNTGSRPRKPGELSPYSVFNPQCKPIEGTLDASQFEREIRYGIGGYVSQTV
ncbi:SAYSVFN motif domain containing 1 isoform X1 [Halictus rubicundus]|uniref:SAYSVFN motif domain containing 1 isoform X1 n=1 Tax=Halictus rubicundus TaxID=77578 RepID=UPI004035EB8B